MWKLVPDRYQLGFKFNFGYFCAEILVTHREFQPQQSMVQVKLQIHTQNSGVQNRSCVENEPGVGKFSVAAQNLLIVSNTSFCILTGFSIQN
jgi:hypothetical protein